MTIHGSESYILYSKWFGICCATAGFGVFPNAEEIVQGDVDEISFGFVVGARVMFAHVHSVCGKDVLSNGNWNGQLWR